PPSRRARASAPRMCGRASRLVPVQLPFREQRMPASHFPHDPWWLSLWRGPPRQAHRRRRRGLPFALIADAAPQALRRAEWLAHPNGALGVAAVHLRVPSLSAALASLREPPVALEPVRSGGSE